MIYPTLCIYHASCDDGFGAAWVVRRACALAKVPLPEFYAGQYQQEPPDVTGHDVYLVDFSYKRPVLERLLQDAKSVTVLDHHQTAEADLSGLLENPIDGKILHGRFIKQHSGCVITWKWFFPHSVTPYLLRIIEDRDLWRFDLPHTKEYTAWLRSQSHDFDLWDTLVADFEHDDGGRTYEQGAALLRAQQKQIDSAVEKHWFMLIDNYRVPVVNATLNFSEISNKMSVGHPFAATFFHVEKGDHVVFSLRSQDDGIDVSEVAKRFGGGGHKHAAGFKIPWDRFHPACIIPPSEDVEAA